MTAIAPAILVDTEEAYKESVERLQPFAQRVHVDLSDGAFAPHFTVGVDKLWWPPEWQVDIHAMVAQPSAYAAVLVALKPHLIIFHAEVEGDDVVAAMQQVKQQGVNAGIALQRSTVPSTVAAAIEAADHVMIFSGSLGEYGGVASLMQLEKIRLIKAINAGAEIGWDGGVTPENAFTLSQGGVDVLNVGKTLAAAADPAQIYATLEAEVNKRGVI